MFHFQVASGDVLKEAVQFAKSIADKPLSNRIVSQMPVKDADKVQVLMEGTA